MECAPRVRNSSSHRTPRPTQIASGIRTYPLGPGRGSQQGAADLGRGPRSKANYPICRSNRPEWIPFQDLRWVINPFRGRYSANINGLWRFELPYNDDYVNSCHEIAETGSDINALPIRPRYVIGR